MTWTNLGISLQQTYLMHGSELSINIKEEFEKKDEECNEISHQGWRPKQGIMQGYSSPICLTMCQSAYTSNKRNKQNAPKTKKRSKVWNWKQRTLDGSMEGRDTGTSETPLTAKRWTPESRAVRMSWGTTAAILRSWRWQWASNSLKAPAWRPTLTPLIVCTAVEMAKTLFRTGFERKERTVTGAWIGFF